MKSFINYLFLAFLLLLSTLYSQRHFTDTYTYRDNFRINTKTQVAEVIYSYSNQSYKGTSEEIARQVLNENKENLGFDNISSLELIEIIESHGSKHVGFIQTYNNIPVYRSETVVSINEKNQVMSIANGCVPLNTIKNTEASISKSDAIALASSKINLNKESLIGIPEAELCYYPDSTYQIHLAWKVNISANDPGGSWEFLVDATSGNILHFMDNCIRANGQGNVFKPDPITFWEDPDLFDYDDQSYKALTDALLKVTLSNLNPAIGGLYRLQGTYARSEDIASPNFTPVTSSTASFLYNRSQHGFEETNAYYFINLQRQYIGSLGFSPTWNGNSYIRFDAHGTLEQNAWYDPTYRYIIFGDGCIDAAEDHSIILHEYAHALHDALMIGTPTGTWERGISEGTGDYMAVSYRRSLLSPVYKENEVAPWFFNGECIPGRELNSEVNYPADWSYYDVYSGGIVWASTLMDIQNSVDMNRSITTKLLLKSFNYINSSTIVPEHIYYFFWSDLELYITSHLKTLGRCFYNRGFFNEKVVNQSLVHPSNLLSGNITSSTTWSGIKWVNSNVYIKPGVTVTNNSFLFIDDNKKIIIENGATLRLGGVTTKYTNADIQVNQGGTLIILPPILKEGAVNEENKSALPTEYELLGNYPNPFNPSTTISFYLPEESNIELIIYNTLGQKVREFVLANQSSGTHKIVWDGMNEHGEALSSGVYIYTINFKSKNNSQPVRKTAKLVLAK